MTHVLGVYWAPQHGRPGDETYIERLQPPFVRLLDPDVAQIARVHQLAPNAVILPRNWQIDDSNKQATRDLMANPVAAGRSWADRYAEWLESLYQQARERGLKMPPRSQIMFCAANEPNEGGEHPQIAAASIAFLERLTFHLLRGLAVVFGPGHPHPLPVEKTWRDHYHALMLMIQASQHTDVPHMLELHEYWRKEGPHYQEPGRDSDWTWLAGRLLRLPYDVPILVGECGVEGRIYDIDLGPHTGWRSYGITPEAYAQQIQDYIRGLDPRVKGVLPFLTDYRSNQWQSFDTETAHGALLARRHMMTPMVQPLHQTHTVHIPTIIAPPPDEPTATPPTPQPQPDTRRIDPRVMEAIMSVEAGRRTHNEDGNAIIRFEAHIFKRELRNDEMWARHFRVGTPAWHDQEWRPSPTDGWRRIHTGRQADEYAVLEFAQRLNREAAYRSISVGAPQIMGFHHARIGYSTALLMWQAFTDSVSAQMIAMCNFVLTDQALHAAVNAHDWPRIGKIYNGQESAGEKYRAAYVRLWGAP